METRTPPVGKVLTMVLFTLACIGLLLFLWLSFGGTIPFNPEGYRIQVPFTNAMQLPAQADVRIAGVNVGKVVKKELDPRGNRTLVTLDIDSQYAPIRQDALAILRQKTILGETYVQITPGSPNAPPVPDNGLLARSNVQNATTLDELFNTFNAPTRTAFQVWQAELAKAIVGNDQNLNFVFGNLPTFAHDATDVLAVLDIEHNAVVGLVRNGGTVFDALGANQVALRNLITSSESTFSETAANQNKLAQVFQVFPTFLDQSRLTFQRLQTFALNTDPLLRELFPVARNLGPTLNAVAELSPYLQHLFSNLDPLITVSQTGLPAATSVLRGAIPVLGALGPFLEQLNPILTWLSLHQQLTSDFISNGAGGLAAKTTYFGGAGLHCGGAPCGHYLRQYSPSGPENMQFHQTRDANNRGNNYPPPLWLADVLDFSVGGHHPGTVTFPAWDCPPGAHNFQNASGGPGGPEACWIAPPLGNILGQPQKFPHLTAARYSGR